MLQKKYVKGVFLWAVTVTLSAFFFSGCNDRAGHKAGIKIRVVQLDREVIQKWLEQGLNGRATGDSAARVLLQFYTATAEKDEGLGLLAYPANSYTSVHIKGRTVLRSVDTAAVSFSGEAILANNFFFLNWLNLIDSTNGRLTDFKYVTFRPIKGESNYIVFDAEVTKSNGEKVFYSRITDPCPPYCNSSNTK